MAFGDRAQYIDVKKDHAAMEEMVKISGGKRQVPVVVEGGRVTVGYGGS